VTSDTPVTLSIGGAVATITLQRPSLSVVVKEQLLAALTTVAGKGEVRAVVLTGSGRGFCFGQDLAEHAEMLTGSGDPLSTVGEHYNPIVLAITGMAKPVIAAINGTCVGAGLGIALACDLRVAAAGAKMATAFTGIGLTCDSGLSATLVQAAGQARASELVLLGETFTAEQAQTWGIVSQVVDGAALADTVATLATRLAAGPTLAFAESKALLRPPGLADTLAAEQAAQSRLGATADHRGAVQSFLAKETPDFSGS